MESDPTPPVPPEGIDQDGSLDAGILGRAVWLTEVGKVRSRNEDRVLVKQAFGGRFLLLLVTDGAGGHDAGDRAAMTVAAVFNERFPEEGEPPEGDVGLWLREILFEAHHHVTKLSRGQARPPAATAVGLLIERASAAAWRFHSGDSRLYAREPEGELIAWTRDHNIANGLIDRGLPAEQALKIAEGGRLTQIIGGTNEPDPDILGPIALVPGTGFHICSDGIYGYNEGRDPLTPSADSSRDLDERLEELRAAIFAGPCQDNFTVILWDVPADLEASEPRETVPQQVRGPDAEAQADIERFGSMFGNDEEEDDESYTEISPPHAEADIGGALLTLLLVAVAVLVVAGYGLSVPSEGAPSHDPHAAGVSEPTPDPRPWPKDAELRRVTEGLVDALDPLWWDALSVEQQSARVEVLAALAQMHRLESTVLGWPEGPDGSRAEAEFLDWPAQSSLSSENRDAVKAAWQARQLAVASMPKISALPAVSLLLREAGCRQIEVRWSEGASAGPPVGAAATPTEGGPVAPLLQPGKLVEWLDVCTQGDFEEQLVRLGRWPEAGWSKADLDGLRELANKAGGATGLLSSTDPLHAELAQVLQLVGRPDLSRLGLRIQVNLPPEDVPPGIEGEAATKLAVDRADEIARLIREASRGALYVESSGAIASDLVEPVDPSQISEDQRVLLADLNRRVELSFLVKPTGSVAPPSTEAN